MKEHGQTTPPIPFSPFAVTAGERPEAGRTALFAQLVRAILGQRQEILATAAIAVTLLAGITLFLQQLAEHGW
jgi:hypothetical protein